MARLNIAEKRLPQDGRIKMRVQGREIDVRVSIIPMIHGEGIVMRLLDKGRMVFNLANVGMLPDIYKHVQASSSTGRTASSSSPGRPAPGKSTTLYSALNEIKDETTQDHHRRRPGRISAGRASARFRCTRKIGLTFAAALRSILRHDPDVILIGEIRDLETAESGHPGVAHRPPGVQHAAHQRRPERVHPADRHGRRAVPRRQHGRRGHGPAAGADDLPGLQDGVRPGPGRTADRLPEGREPRIDPQGMVEMTRSDDGSSGRGPAAGRAARPATAAGPASTN